jgi:hypothetical protein
VKRQAEIPLASILTRRQTNKIRNPVNPKKKKEEV